MNINKLIVIFVTLLLFAVSDRAAGEVQKVNETSSGQTAGDVRDANATPEKIFKGTVLDSQTGGKYAYLQLDVNGEKVWIATMIAFLKTTLGEGDKVEYVGGLPMKDFKSKVLDKTFKSILFVTRIRVLTKKSINVPADEYHNNKNNSETIVKAVPPKENELQKAKNGKTIREIITERNSLKGKEVILQAKVMKISKNILKMNWITLQDGTGAPPDDKIIFITNETPRINDILTVKGTVKTDVNLGGNYKYKVLLEKVITKNK